MRLTLFGETVRQLRMKYDLTLKEMATEMRISSAHLSAIEYGEKRLSEKHIDEAVKFFRSKATKDQLEQIREAGEKSQEFINTSNLPPDARGLVAAFARRLQDGAAPMPEIINWIENKNSQD